MSTKEETIQIDETAWVHESALLFGNISVGRKFDLAECRHARRNVSHTDRRPNQYSRFRDDPCRRDDPTIIGDDCSITHHATLHGCKLGDKCLVGINSTIMDGAVIGNNCIVAGHSIVTEGSNFPDNSIIAGSPAKLLKTRDSSVANKANADFYVLNAKTTDREHTGSPRMNCILWVIYEEGSR